MRSISALRHGRLELVWQHITQHSCIQQSCVSHLASSEAEKIALKKTDTRMADIYRLPN